MKAGELICCYRLSCNGTTANGGRCVWAFGTKDGQEYFIKQFLTPKYPIPGKALGSEKRKRILKEKCERFEQQQLRFMTEFRHCGYLDRNLTVPVQFMRVGPFYYTIAPKIEASSISVKDIAELPLERKLLIAKTATRCIKTLHDRHIAHGDLKPHNILIKKTKTDEFVAKLIDFDDSFFEGEINDNPKEVVGDFVYYSPELLRYIKLGGDELRAKVTCKSDIFALGIIYHEYFYGQLPAFNKPKYKYLAVSVLDGKRPGLGRLRLKNKKFSQLIRRMLSVNPDDRPSAQEALDELEGIDRGKLERGVTTLHGIMRRLKGTLPGVTKRTLAEINERFLCSRFGKLVLGKSQRLVEKCADLRRRFVKNGKLDKLIKKMFPERLIDCLEVYRSSKLERGVATLKGLAWQSKETMMETIIGKLSRRTKKSPWARLLIPMGGKDKKYTPSKRLKGRLVGKRSI